MTAPFITVTDVADSLGRPLVAEPAALPAVEAACELCRSEAGQAFTLGTATAYYDGSGTDALVLRDLPVSTIGTVTVDGTAVTDYVLGDNGVLFRGTAGGGVWPTGRQNVAISYTTGYAAIPAHVKQVAIQVATRILAQGIAASEQIGDVRIAYSVPGPLDLTANEQRILRNESGR